MRFLVLILKNVRRNLFRSGLTVAATMGLVVVVTLVWSVLSFLDEVTAEKNKNLKAIVSERWQFPSQMPISYATTLAEGAARTENDARPTDSMTWQFFGGRLGGDDAGRNDRLFAFAMEPRKLKTMMDDLDTLPSDQAAELDRNIERLEKNRQGILLGRDWLTILNKRIGDRFVLNGMNYKGINLELEVIGVFPPGRYDKSAVINRDYLNGAIDAWPRQHNGQPHFLSQKRLNLVWLRVPDSAAFAQVASQIEQSPYYQSPSVKCETASSGIASFLDSYRDLIRGMRFFLAPAAIISLALVIANAISISVRERRLELAVMKVLGFRPWQILVLVLGEAVLLGAGSGLISAGGTWYVVNEIVGGLKFPIAFFPSFYVASAAWWWGPLVGGLAALLGSIFPAVSACRVKVSEVFAKVT